MTTPTPTPPLPTPAVPHVSVIVPVRDRKELLRDCLTALAQQDYRDFEVVVVDDGSADGSGDVARTFRDRLALTVVRTPGVGAVLARCRGVEEARGEVLAFTDSDCVPETGWLRAGITDIDGGADVVQGRTLAARTPRPLERTLTARSDDGAVRIAVRRESDESSIATARAVRCPERNACIAAAEPAPISRARTSDCVRTSSMTPSSRLKYAAECVACWLAYAALFL